MAARDKGAAQAWWHSCPQVCSLEANPSSPQVYHIYKLLFLNKGVFGTWPVSAKLRVPQELTWCSTGQRPHHPLTTQVFLYLLAPFVQEEKGSEKRGASEREAPKERGTNTCDQIVLKRQGRKSTEAKWGAQKKWQQKYSYRSKQRNLKEQGSVIKIRNIFKQNSLLGKHGMSVENFSIDKAQQEEKTHIQWTQEWKTSINFTERIIKQGREEEMIKGELCDEKGSSDKYHLHSEQPGPARWAQNNTHHYLHFSKAEIGNEARTQQPWQCLESSFSIVHPPLNITSLCSSFPAHFHSYF